MADQVPSIAGRSRLRKVEERRHNFYSGSLEEIAALGFAPLEAFPGQPGRPLTTVCIRPQGAVKVDGSWYNTPGYVWINRTASGRYQMRVAVSKEVRAQREADEDKRAKEAEQAARQETAVRDSQKRHAALVMLEAAAKYLGPAEVIAYVERSRRAARPTSAPSHLRVVWSAPR